jgi:hypothetical protein
MSGLLQSRGGRRLNRTRRHCTCQYMLCMTGHVRSSAELRWAVAQQAQAPLYKPMCAPDDCPCPDSCRAQAAVAQQAQAPLYKPMHASDDWPCPDSCRAEAGGGSTGSATTVQYKPMCSPDDCPCPVACRAEAGGSSTGPRASVHHNMCSVSSPTSGLLQ